MDYTPEDLDRAKRIIQSEKGKKRWEGVSKEERSKAGKKAINKRWGKTK